MSEAYGIVHVSVSELLKKEIGINRELGKTISAAVDAGEPVADHIVNGIIEKRLNETDCRVNGWILEGFPKSKAQIALLKAMRIKPAIVFVLEQGEEESIRRLSNKQVDPESGAYYNIQVQPPSDETINSRLINQVCDSEAVVRKLYKGWRDQQPLVEDAYRQYIVTLQGDRSIEEVTNLIRSEIESTMRA